MKDGYKLKSSKELIDYLTEQERDPFHDFDYQLETNYGFVHELKSGAVIFFPNNFRNEALIFKNKNCFNKVIKSDHFPVDNPEKDLFEIEIERIKVINTQADFYRRHLNNILKFAFKEINKEAAQAYLKRIIGRSIKKLTTETDVMALICVVGEIFKEETNGRWFLEKQYRLYNPIFVPNIITADSSVIKVTDMLLTQIKWKVSSLDMIFSFARSEVIDPIKFKKYSRGRHILILE
ncbi:MAG TPA: hypothetical protein PLD84_08235 [Chitinophagales bacterium]|nr:hypothetical protein [Chitinophagales bacterium]